MPIMDLPAEHAPYDKILTAIIKRFVRLVGASAAINVAQRIPHLAVDAEGNVLAYNRDNPLETVNLLINQYSAVFGDMAFTLSQRATRSLADIYDLLQESERSNVAPPAPIRILVVDDQMLFRNGLVNLINPQTDMIIVGQAGTIQEALSLVRTLQPDLVLMSIALSDGSGIEATQTILAERSETKVALLTNREDDEQLFAAIRAGAVGYWLKNMRTPELLKRVRSIARRNIAPNDRAAHP